MPFLPVSLILTTIAFLTSFGCAIYAWYPVMRYPIVFRNSLPFPHKVTGKHTKGVITYQSPFAYTPEVWNCALSPYVVNPSQSQRLNGLCQEASAARYMMIPVILLSAGLLVSLAWSWRKASLAAASDEVPAEKEVEEVSVYSKN